MKKIIFTTLCLLCYTSQMQSMSGKDNPVIDFNGIQKTLICHILEDTYNANMEVYVQDTYSRSWYNRIGIMSKIDTEKRADILDKYIKKGKRFLLLKSNRLMLGDNKIPNSFGINQ